MTASIRSTNPNQIPAVWETNLLSQAEALTFWQPFEGEEGSSMPIIRKDDLTKVAGDTIKTDLSLKLNGTGTTGDTTLTDGNEEAIKFTQIQFVVDMLKHGTRWSDLEDSLITHNMRGVALEKLKKWLAGKLDNNIFNEAVGNGSTTLPTSAKWYAGTATSIGAINATAPTGPGVAGTGTLTLRDITEIKYYMVTENYVEPMMTADGQEYFGLVCHPYSLLALKRDDTQWAQAQRDGNLRGTDNPIFTGALGVWDGVILYSNKRVPVANDGASGIQVARNIFFGAQLASRGYAMYPKWVEQEFSYGEEVGIATRTVLGQKLNAFDLTAAQGAAAANYTSIGGAVLYASAVPPTA